MKKRNSDLIMESIARQDAIEREVNRIKLVLAGLPFELHNEVWAINQVLNTLPKLAA